MKLTGYAAVYNSDSADMGFVEQIVPGAFDNDLASRPDVKGLFNHSADYLLGSTTAGTVRLSSDSVGLRYEIDVNPDDDDARAVFSRVQRRDITGSSFSFQTIRDKWDYQADPPRRWILEARLIDVSPVVFPAYPDASVSASGQFSPRSFHQRVEARAGKRLSAATVEKITAVMSQLRELLDGDAPDEETLIDQALEEDSIPAALKDTPRAVTLAQMERQLAARATRYRDEQLIDLAMRHHEQQIEADRLWLGARHG